MSTVQTDQYINQRLVTFAKWLAVALVGIATILGACITYGWVLDAEICKHMFMSGPVIWSSVGINTVLLATVLSLLIACFQLPLSAKVVFGCKVVGSVLCFIVFASALSTVIETLGGLDLGLNHIWYRPSEDSSGLSYPGPMTPDVSLAFIALSVALFIQTWLSVSKIEIAQWLCVIALGVTSLPLVGAMSGAESLCTFFGCLRMSEAISILFILLSGSCFLLRPDQGLSAFLWSYSAAGLVARRAALLVIFLPALFGLRFALVHYKIVDNSLGWVAFGVGGLSLAIALVVSGVRSAEQLMTSAVRVSPALVAPSSEASGNSIQSFGTGSFMGIDGLIQAPVPSDRVRKVCLACEVEFSKYEDVCPECESALTRMIDKSLVGQLFADKYEVVWALGDGGMASVYLAKHVYTKQDVAIKVLHASLAGNIHGVKRFQQEAKALGTLNHPNIVGVKDFGFTTDGEAFLAMEYVKGTALSDLISKQKSLTMYDTALIMVQVCEALLHAHGAGIIHRDLKPSNIMCSPDGHGGYDVKVVDFGLAKMSGRDDPDMIKLTQTGDCQGSPPYMSPEQCTAKPVDYRSDIYSLGCIVFECLVGTPPFLSTSVFETMTMHVSTPAPGFPPNMPIPQEVRSMVSIALEKNPEARQKSVDEIQSVLVSVIS